VLVDAWSTPIPLGPPRPRPLCAPDVPVEPEVPDVPGGLEAVFFDDAAVIP
jgi:hypothetical protein